MDTCLTPVIKLISQGHHPVIEAITNTRSHCNFLDASPCSSFSRKASVTTSRLLGREGSGDRGKPYPTANAQAESHGIACKCASKRVCARTRSVKTLEFGQGPQRCGRAWLRRSCCGRGRERHHELGAGRCPDLQCCCSSSAQVVDLLLMPAHGCCCQSGAWCRGLALYGVEAASNAESSLVLRSRLHAEFSANANKLKGTLSVVGVGRQLFF
jgi:hypothetical protein